MTEMKLKIKPTSGGSLFEVMTTPAATISELKEEVSKQLGDTTAEQIKLIYKGTSPVREQSDRIPSLHGCCFGQASV